MEFEGFWELTVLSFESMVLKAASTAAFDELSAAENSSIKSCTVGSLSVLTSEVEDDGSMGSV